MSLPRPGVVFVFAALLLSGCATEKVRAVQKSMEPTIRSGEYLLLDSGAYTGSDPLPGDIVFSRIPKGAETDTCGVRAARGSPCPRPTPSTSDAFSVIKRVAAVGGERIAFDARGRAIVDGRVIEQDSVIECEPGDLCALPKAILVPPGSIFLLGDNRPYSSDSRLWGPVPVTAIEGEAQLPDPD